MARIIKRYGSRKLYDTDESRYISLEEIAQWIRDGGEVQVIDNQTSDDVTAQTLTQVILDEGRRGRSFLGSDLLHDLIRFGEAAVSTGVKHLQEGVDRFVSEKLTRLEPVHTLQEEVAHLRSRLEAMDSRIRALADGEEPENGSKGKRRHLFGRILSGDRPLDEEQEPSEPESST